MKRNKGSTAAACFRRAMKNNISIDLGLVAGDSGANAMHITGSGSANKSDHLRRTISVINQ